MRARGWIAAGVVAVFALVPVGLATPAQAADAVRSLSCISSVTCNPANLPIVAELGIGSAGGVTTATGATGAATATGLAGTVGFGTVVGASGAAVGLGLLKVYGVEEGVFIETDPEYDSGVVPGQGPTVVLGGQSLTFFGLLPGDHRFACFKFVGAWSGIRIEYHTSASSTLFASAGTAGGTAATNCASAYGGVQADWGSVFAGGSVTITEVVRYGYYSGGVWQARSDDFAVPQEGYHGTIRTTVGCRAPGSTQLSYVTATARVDVEQGERLPVPPARCDVGIAASVKVEYQADGTMEWIELGAGDARSYVERWPVDYPDCFNGTLTCALKLWRVSEGGMLASCGEVGQYCPSWAAEAKLNPNAYRCTYGPYDVTLAHCSVYRDPSVGVLPNDSGEEDEDGEPVPLPIDAPVPDPLPNPMTNPDGTPAPSPGGESSQPRECFPTGWGVFNPVEWVLKPMRCAFEPSEGKLEEVKAKVQQAWAGSVIAGAIAIGGGIAVAMQSVDPEGCEGPLVAFTLSGLGIMPDFQYSAHPLSACEEPAATVAWWARAVGSAVMLFFAALACVGNITRIVNYSGKGPTS